MNDYDGSLFDIVPNPIDIKKELDKYIIGQDEAKRLISILVLNRALLKMNRQKLFGEGKIITKTNLLLLGSTGSGKTALINALSEIIDIPILKFDVTGLTASGYHGANVEDVLVSYCKLWEDYLDIVQARKSLEDVYSGNNYFDILVEELGTGIIYLDEIDKICDHTTINEVSGFGDLVQNELLKFLEGGTIDLSGSKFRCWYKTQLELQARPSVLNTTNITFICGGAFSGLTDIIARRLNRTSSIGFTSNNNKILLNNKDEGELLKYLTTEDLQLYGFKSEFLGRLALKASLTTLSVDILVKIMKESKFSVLNTYIDLFNIFNIEVIFSDDALKLIADYALELKTGARALSQILMDVMNDKLFNVFEIKDNILIIDKDYVEGKLNERDEI